MATQREIRRAIWYGDQYIRRLTETIKWKGRDLTLIKSFPWIPIKVYNRETERWIIPGGICLGKIYHEKEWHGTFGPMVKLTETLHTGDRWKGSMGFIARPYTDLTDFEKPMHNNPTLIVDYMTSADTVIVDLEWVSSESHVDVYVGNHLIWENAIDPPDKKKTITFKDGQELRSHRYVADTDLYMYALHGWYNRLDRVRAKSIFDALGDYRYYPSPYDPLYRLSDKRPDTWIRDISSLLEINDTLLEDFERWIKGDLSVTFFLPLYTGEKITKELPGPVYFPHLSYKSYCRNQLELVSLGRVEFDSWIAMRAMHIMNKYNDPNVKDDLGNTAYDYLFNKYKDDMGYEHTPIVKHVDGFGYLPKSGLPYFSPMYILPAFAELGYGFHHISAQVVADFLTDRLIQSQWGHQTDFADATYRTKDYGVINRPEHIGGFIKAWNVHYGEPRPYEAVDIAKIPPVESLIETQQFSGYSAETVGRKWTPPMETLMYVPTTAEWTLAAVRALRIYEAYKYRI